MKKKSILALVLSLVALLAIGGVALAWTASPLTSTGSLNVAEGEAFTLDSSVLAWGDTSIVLDGTVALSTTVLVTNTGLTDIAGFTLTSVVNSTGLLLAVTTVPVASGASVGLEFTLTGTAPGTVQTIDLTGITCDLLPN